MKNKAPHCCVRPHSHQIVS